MTQKIFAIIPMLIAVALIPVAFADHPLTHGYQNHTSFSYYDPGTNKYITVQTWSYTPNEREKEIIQAAEDEPEVVEEIIEEIVEEEPERLDTSDPKEAMEFYIDKLEEEAELGELSVADEELLKMLHSVQEICYLGIEEGRLIQKFAEFIIPTYEPDVETDLSNKWLLNQLFKKQQECQGWDVYKRTHLGQQYLDIEDVNINKAEIIKAELLSKYNTDYTDPVTQRDLDDEADRSKQIICNSTLWGDGLKGDAGCFDAQELNGGTIEFSKQGQIIMDKFTLYQKTGELDVPKPKVESEPLERDSIARQYLAALGYTLEEIDAALAALEADK